MNDFRERVLAVHPTKARVDEFRSGDNELPECVPLCEMLWPTDLRTEDETEAWADAIAGLPDLLAEVERLRERVAELEAALHGKGENYE